MTRILSSKSRPYPFFSLREDLLEHPDGRNYTYSFLHIPVEAAAILAKDDAGRWLLTREYRHPTGQKLLGCPGGRFEPGEDPLQGALREFREETGYTAERLIPLGASYPLSGLTNQKIHYFFAPKIHLNGAPEFDPFEFIEIEWKTPEELDEELRRSQHVDGVLCNALFRYHLCL
jgi:ADP-ribose pyrophosphatase